MKPKSRYLNAQIQDDLKRKMVFLGGPRQVGKTTLAQSLARDLKGYLNWDIPGHRMQILKRELPNTELWIFDEIHKHRPWRNYLKGLFDEFKGTREILVTGSARLDLYRRGGDSLQGRYHFLRLHPLSLAEIAGRTESDLLTLMKLGGFPEPFFSQSETQAKRWSKEYQTRVVQEDIRDLERVQDLGNLELLLHRLPEHVGSPLSLNSLREDLHVSHRAVSQWMEIFDRTYCIFRLAPFGSPKIRAVKKERKHYHFDWTLISDEALRFENLVAVHLQKWIHFQEDVYGKTMELRYFRDTDRREVDFVVLENGKPVQFIECKLSDGEVSSGLRYLKAKFPKVESIQIALKGQKDVVTSDGISLMPAHRFLAQLV
ncbi:MAG: ATP-binding protein [Bdellovibrionales bacterium]|nr:ATP-binding protein [Bdellovibrionales bacterium]